MLLLHLDRAADHHSVDDEEERVEEQAEAVVEHDKAWNSHNEAEDEEREHGEVDDPSHRKEHLNVGFGEHRVKGQSASDEGCYCTSRHDDVAFVANRDRTEHVSHADGEAHEQDHIQRRCPAEAAREHADNHDVAGKGDPEEWHTSSVHNEVVER